MRPQTYPMFVTDLVDLLQHAPVVNGYVRCRWKVVKRGSNYGIARVDGPTL